VIQVSDRQAGRELQATDRAALEREMLIQDAARYSLIAGERRDGISHFFA